MFRGWNYTVMSLVEPNVPQGQKKPIKFTTDVDHREKHRVTREVEYEDSAASTTLFPASSRVSPQPQKTRASQLESPGEKKN